MEPFKWTRQSVAFMTLMISVAVIVAVAAPFGSIALGAAALLAIGVVLIKAMLRARQWWPLTATSRIGQRTRAVSYSDPSRQQRLKHALREAGIPFTVKMEDGKEFVGWTAEHDAAADAINQKVSEDPLRWGRNAHLPDAALHNQFTAWLTAKGIKHEVVQMQGKDWVVWDESAGDLVRQFMEGRSNAGCNGKVAASKPGAAPC